MHSKSSVFVAFLAVNMLAAIIAIGLSGSVAFVSWLVPDEAHELGRLAPLVVD